MSLKDVRGGAGTPASTGRIWLSLDRAAAIRVKHFASSHQNLEEKKSGLVLVEMQPGCRVARFPGGEASPLTAPAYIPGDASLAASFFSTSLMAENTFKKIIIVIATSLYQFHSVQSFNLHLMALAPCVSWHLFTSETSPRDSFF